MSAPEKKTVSVKDFPIEKIPGRGKALVVKISELIHGSPMTDVAFALALLRDFCHIEDKNGSLLGELVYKNLEEKTHAN